MINSNAELNALLENMIKLNELLVFQDIYNNNNNNVIINQQEINTSSNIYQDNQDSTTTTSNSTSTANHHNHHQVQSSLLLKYLNRTNSNTSCNSSCSSSGLDSGYLSSNDSINNLTSSLSHSLSLCSNNSTSSNSSGTANINEHINKYTVTYGYFGKAKNTQLEDTNTISTSTNYSATTTSSFYRQLDIDNNHSLIDHVNHGDDVGFVLTKTSDNEDLISNSNNTNNNNNNAATAYYFGIADGVSANRLRGYDAKLFPNALLHSCANHIAATNSNSIDPHLNSNDEFSTTANYEINEIINANTTNNEQEQEQDDQVENEEEEEVFDQEEDEKECDDEDDDDKDDFDSEYGVVLDSINELNNTNYPSDQNSDSISSVDFLNCSTTINNDCKYLYKTLLNAHNDVQDQKVYGSSTVCLLSLKFLNHLSPPNTTNRRGSSSNNNDEDYYSSSNYSSYSCSNYCSTTALLSTCNLGDSGYLIIRNKQVIFKSQTQTHRFNAPYQLGCTPPELLDHDLYRDKPEDSICLTHEIKSGDFILVSSDGLFDNLYEDEIALIIDNHIKSSIASNLNAKQASNLLINNSSSQDDSYYSEQIEYCSTKTVLNTNTYNPNLITNDLLSSACELLVQKASKAGIKRDDMLIILVYVN